MLYVSRLEAANGGAAGKASGCLSSRRVSRTGVLKWGVPWRVPGAAA